jgi:hypothetical protein
MHPEESSPNRACQTLPHLRQRWSRAGPRRTGMERDQEESALRRCGAVLRVSDAPMSLRAAIEIGIDPAKDERDSEWTRRDEALSNRDSDHTRRGRELTVHDRNRGGRGLEPPDRDPEGTESGPQRFWTASTADETPRGAFRPGHASETPRVVTATAFRLLSCRGRTRRGCCWCSKCRGPGATTGSRRPSRRRHSRRPVRCTRWRRS